MVAAVTALELAMGDGVKVVEGNELESRVVQRRALRLRCDVGQGEVLTSTILEALRPCPDGAYTPSQITDVLGRCLVKGLPAGREIYPDDLE